MTQREQIASTINQSLHRLPLVLEILEEIHESRGPRHAGDEELEYGSLRAIQKMTERLRGIESAGNIRTQSKPPSVAEQIAGEWLLGDRPRRLLPKSIVEELAALIAFLLPGERGIPDSVAGRHETAS